jgi:hypothetical protein
MRETVLDIAYLSGKALLFRLLAAAIKLPIAQELLDLAAETEAYAADIERRSRGSHAKRLNRG